MNLPRLKVCLIAMRKRSRKEGMNVFNRYIGNSTKLFTRLMAVLSACILPVCALSLVSNAYEQEAIRQAIDATQESNVAYYLEMLEQELSRLRNITYSYMNDQELQELSVVYDTLSDYKRAETVINVRKKLMHIRQISSYVANIYVYLPAMERTINAINTDYELSEEEIAWYMSQENLAKPVMNENEQLMICSYHPMTATADRLPAMLLAVEIDPAAIREILSKASPEEGGAMLIGEDWSIQLENHSLDDGSSFSSLLPIWKERSSGTKRINWADTECLFAWRYSAETDTTLFVYIPQDAVLGELWRIERLLWLLLVAAAAALTGTAFVIYRMVHVPMWRMVEAFREVENGNQEIRLAVHGSDEFRYLYDRFNRMLDHLNSLIQQVYTQRILSQQSQLKQLQMQINPHFFYNSFFAIQGMIEMGDTQTATRMLQNIGNYFRYITRNARNSVPLREEVAHARSYCEIQRIRFENIEISFENIPEGYADFIVPRLILQPLIENAYLHGLEDKEDAGILKVRFYAEKDGLFIEVEDDGGGISKEQLEKLRRDMQENEGLETTAIINIHRRLKLFFGEEAGISLAQNEHNGLQVTIFMPAKGDRHV